MTNSYEIPHLLKEMITWEEEIKQEVPYLETPTGYFLQFDPHDNGGYMSFPVMQSTRLHVPEWVVFISPS